MGFDGSKAFNPRWEREGADLRLHWDTDAPAGTVFQVYVGRELAWSGIGTSCRIPCPSTDVPIDVGAVGPGEAHSDFSPSLPAVPLRRPRLVWYGGTFLSDSIAGFRVYRGNAPGDPVDYETPVGSVTAYPGGLILDGAGIGPAGEGGAGQSANTFEWTGEPLGNGTWHFGVKAYDVAGDEGEAAEFSVTIAVPPEPPARNAAGDRLTGVYEAAGRTVTLNWLPSPG